MSSYFAGRRVLVPLILLSIVLCVSACGKNAPGSPASSSVAQNGPLGSGMTPEPGTNGKPMPLPDGHYESMVASNGVDYVGSDNGRLYALNGKDGAMRWQYNAGAPVYVAAVMQGVVYADASNGNSAVAYAINAGTGSVLWHYNVNDYISDLMAENGVVYVGTAATGNTPRLYALRAGNGSLLWSYTANAETPGLLAASDGMVFYAEILGIGSGNFSEHITALRSSDGSVAWRLPIAAAGGFARGIPAIANDVIYIATNNGSVYAVRMSDGTVLWHVAHSGGFDAIPLDMSPLVDNGVVYVEGKQGPGGEYLSLFAMRAGDGTLLWSKSLGFAPAPMVDQPQVVNGVMYVVNGVTGLVALREADGSLLWQHTADQVFGPFVVANGLIHINGGNGVLALRTGDGSVAWKSAISSLQSESSAGPAEVVDNGIVYVATMKGIVQALDASNGQMLWHYVIQELAVPTEPIYGAYVQFSAAVSFQQAIQLITDLGLQTIPLCAIQWKPMSSAADFANGHSLIVAATVNSAPLWFNRLQAMPGVTSLQAAGPHSCPMMRYDPNALRFLGPDVPVTYVKVTFSSGTSYDAAMGAVNNLGFRLANPCYEQARARGDKPAWNTAGEESAFGSSHTLLLATTAYNATAWLSQLKTVAGVTKIDEPLKVTC